MTTLPDTSQLPPRRDYSDIIALAHHRSPAHASMSMAGRAAQFAPFAALSGYAEAIAEASRPVEKPVELSEHACDRMSRRLGELLQRQSPPMVAVRHFVARGSGGRYVTTIGRLRGVDTFRRALLLAGGIAIKLERIAALKEHREASPTAGDASFFVMRRCVY